MERMQQRFDLTGKVALVTGGSRGLGRAMSLGLADAGADVVVASRTLSACEAVVADIHALGREALAVDCDMRNWADIDRLAERTYGRFGRCDVLVNNAGIMQTPSPLVQTDSALFDEFFEVNVKGPMRLATQVAPRMGAAGGGSIINVISIGGLKPGPNLGMYCSSKAALQALSRVMAAEWAPLKVRVNALAPGPFRTDMMEDMDERIPGFIQHSVSTNMQKRMAEPDEIVGAVLFLASDASSFVTAQTLSVCGGYG
ncbi:MAG: family oxidoreductase [Deltaproteobacteria bacterium]|nr:family oxidoreductase [Deltaproteobacteria bacterium]